MIKNTSITEGVEKYYFSFIYFHVVGRSQQGIFVNINTRKPLFCRHTRK